MTVQTLQDLKIGMQVKVKQAGIGKADQNFYVGTVNGSLDFVRLPTIEIPEGTHGEITHIGIHGEIHIKWVELNVETIGIFHSYEREMLEFEESTELLAEIIDLCKTAPDIAISTSFEHCNTISETIKPETIKHLMALDFQELEENMNIPSVPTHVNTSIEEKICPFIYTRQKPKFYEITSPHWKGEMMQYHTTDKTEAEVWQMVIKDLEDARTR